MTFRTVRRMVSALIPILLLISLSSSQEVVEKKSFEGIIGFEDRDLFSLDLYTVFMKGGKIRIEAAERGGGDAFLLDYGLKKSFVIVSGREQYIERPAVVAPREAAPSQSNIGFQKTELTETILGYPCDQFMWTTEDFEAELWATKGFGAAGTFLSPQVDESHWKILEMGYFPMRFILRDSRGEESRRFEVVSVKKKSLSNSLFRIPSDYEKVDLEALQPKQAPKKKNP
jgi:hypothetical protein